MSSPTAAIGVNLVLTMVVLILVVVMLVHVTKTSAALSKTIEQEAASIDDTTTMMKGGVHKLSKQMSAAASAMAGKIDEFAHALEAPASKDR